MTALIRHYQDSDAQAFLALNRYWIEKYFTFEPSDAAQLTNPKDTILDKGGAILIAQSDGQAVGTIALIPKPSIGQGVVELVKMSVAPDHYGKGLGRALMQAALDQAKHMEASKIWLETNSALKTATHIYEQFGFVALSDADFIPTIYNRCNLQMERLL